MMAESATVTVEEPESRRKWREWRDADNRAEREFRWETKVPRQRLEEEIAALGRIEASAKRGARDDLRNAERAAELARKKALSDVAAALAKARQTYRVTLQSAAGNRAAGEARAHTEFRQQTHAFYSKRRTIKKTAYDEYVDACRREREAPQ